MSSPITVAPLVPRGANKAKKKRPGFRPIGKSTKVNNNQNNKNDSKPKPQTTVQNDSLLLQESPLKAQDHEQIEKSTDEETQEGQGTDRESPQEKSDTTAEPTPKVKSKATIKKRKQSTSISVGFRKKSLVTDSNLESTIGNKRQRPDTATEEQLSSPTSRPKARNKEVEDSHARDSNRNSTGLVVANVPGRTVASQDREILDRLIAEDPQGTRLNTFCSAFKGKKEPRQQRGTQAGNAATTRVRQNRNDGNANANANNARNFHNDALGRNAPDPSGNPVVKIVDGEIVLQESSMMVPGQRRTVEEVEEEFQDVVEEDAHLAIVGASYNSFVNRRGPQHWTLEETKRFFEALRQLGTDFCSMEHFFENRTRKQLKRKYQTELIRNPSLIEMALDPKKKAKVDMSIFDVEVDPKAIEAAAKDEPPPYIPTDLDEQGMCSGTKDENTAPTNAVATAAALAASQGAVSKLEKWKEIIEEDAEEEARAGMGSGKSTKAPKKVTIDEASLWPAAYRNDVRNESMHEDDMHFPEPSMDDFFHEQEDIDDHDIKEDSIEPQGTTPIASPLEVPKVSAAASSISLIPSKASAKSKKPKFRTKSRMRK